MVFLPYSDLSIKASGMEVNLIGFGGGVGNREPMACRGNENIATNILLQFKYIRELSITKFGAG